MGEILTCVLCGRRGTHDFVMVAADPNHPDVGHQARCRHRQACRRRLDAADAEPGGAANDADSKAAERGASAESVAALAREVEGLQNQVHRLKGVPAQVDDVSRVVGELAEQVEALSTRPSKPVAPSWLVMPGEQVEGVLADLVDWLDAVLLRYVDAMAALPDCWAWHPDVVEELLWLQHAWHAAYEHPGASVAAAGDWHDRYRPGVVRRVRAAVGTCSLENHTPAAGPATTPLAGQLAPVTTWWADHRTEPAPEPSEEQYAAAPLRRRKGGGRR